MKVVCIDETGQESITEFPHVKKGRVYTVVDSRKEDEQITMGKKNLRVKYPGGEYYKLAEMGSPYYHHSLFLIIEEDQKDETEFERNYNLQTV